MFLLTLTDVIINMLLIVLTLLFSLYKRHVLDQFLSFGFCNQTRMEATIDMEFVEGIGPEPIVKELAQVGDDGALVPFCSQPHTLSTHTVRNKTI